MTANSVCLSRAALSDIEVFDRLGMPPSHQKSRCPSHAHCVIAVGPNSFSAGTTLDLWTKSVPQPYACEQVPTQRDSHAFIWTPGTSKQHEVHAGGINTWNNVLLQQPLHTDCTQLSTQFFIPTPFSLTLSLLLPAKLPALTAVTHS